MVRNTSLFAVRADIQIMERTYVPTHTATIYVGSYDKDIKFAPTPEVMMKIAEEICQEYVDAVGLCVTLTQTRFIYSNGNENGVAVGLINYPRFPSTQAKIQEQAIELASRLQMAFDQYRVSIVFPDQTVMLSRDGVI